MLKANDLSSLIQVRNYLSAAVDNMTVAMTREQVKQAQAKVNQIDKFIVENALKLDLTADAARTVVVTATQEPENMDEIDKMVAEFDKQVAKPKVAKSAPKAKEL